MPAAGGAHGLLIAIPCYGLANRLRLIASAKVMADALGKTFRLVWDRHRDMPKATRWHDLFESSPAIIELESAGIVGNLKLRLWSLPLAGRGRLHALGGLPRSRKAAHELLDRFTTHENTPYACAHVLQTKPCSTHAELSVAIDPLWRHVSLRGQFNYKLVSMSDDEYMRRMQAFYLSLRPVPAVAALVEALTREFAPRIVVDNTSRATIVAASDEPVTIGVHCRQTDNSRSFYEGLIPAESYHAHIDQAVERFPNARFFVAADTAQARQRIRQRYGDRVLTHLTEMPGADPRLAARYTLVGQRAALADLVALSRTSLIIGTRFSSFTYVAAVLGDVPFVETGLDLTANPFT